MRFVPSVFFRSVSRAFLARRALGIVSRHFLKNFSFRCFEWNLTAGSDCGKSVRTTVGSRLTDHLPLFSLSTSRLNAVTHFSDFPKSLDTPREKNEWTSLDQKNGEKPTKGRNLSSLNLSRHFSQAEVMATCWRCASFRWWVDRLCSAARLAVNHLWKARRMTSREVKYWIMRGWGKE